MMSIIAIRRITGEYVFSLPEATILKEVIDLKKASNVYLMAWGYDIPTTLPNEPNLTVHSVLTDPRPKGGWCEIRWMVDQTVRASSFKIYMGDNGEMLLSWCCIFRFLSSWLAHWNKSPLQAGRYLLRAQVGPFYSSHDILKLNSYWICKAYQVYDPKIPLRLILHHQPLQPLSEHWQRLRKFGAVTASRRVCSCYISGDRVWTSLSPDAHHQWLFVFKEICRHVADDLNILLKESLSEWSLHT